jgi:hypothetical protein
VETVSEELGDAALSGGGGAIDGNDKGIRHEVRLEQTRSRGDDQSPG